jgi:hypothetical protein
MCISSPSVPTYQTRQTDAELKAEQRRADELRQQQYEQRAGARKKGRKSLLTGQAERGFAGTPVMSKTTLGV